MNSNSVRVSAELFEQARSQGALLSRSTAQQLEHWARIGAALEAAGLTVPATTELIAHAGATSEKELWKDKRARQGRDREAVKAGKVTGEQLRWFRNGLAKKVKLVGSPL